MSGFPCAECGSKNCHTLDTRGGGIIEGLRAYRRRRECKHCTHRWTTYELNAQDCKQLEDRILQRLVAELVEAVKRRKK